MTGASENNIILGSSALFKSYRLEKISVPVLRGVDLSVSRGEWVALLGASGSGKTTLLNLLGALERPDSGEIVFQGVRYSLMSRRQAAFFRCAKIGFIFQSYHLLPELSALENVMLPGMLGKTDRSQLRKKAGAILDRVGLGGRVKHRPNELSGGEQQRAAIARALINSPDLILADEPTGNLDSGTGLSILEIFKELHRGETAPAIVMVTHDKDVAALASRIITLRDGKIV
jgi:ABC-type lipoprotein export system ATPase subunit